jgi:hypothetical protein
MAMISLLSRPLKVSIVQECSRLACLSLFYSVQNFTYDILGNAGTISINQALESIHPINKDRFHHFD